MPQTQQPAPIHKPQGFVNILCSQASIKSLENKILKEVFLWSLQAYQTNQLQSRCSIIPVWLFQFTAPVRNSSIKPQSHRNQVIPNSPTNPITLEHKILETITQNLLQPQLTIKQFSNTRTIPGASINTPITFKPTKPPACHFFMQQNLSH